MPWPLIDSPQNASIKIAKLLHTVKEREQQGFLWVEGTNALHEALTANLKLEHLFVVQGKETELDNNFITKAKHISLVSERVIKVLSTTNTPVKLGGIVQAPGLLSQWKAPTQSSKTPQLILVLDGLQDPGNVGALIRSAAAFGVHQLLCLPGTADIFSPKVIRSSTGLCFRMKELIKLNESTYEALNRLKEKGLTITLADRDASNKHALGKTFRLTALVIGQEGQGLRLTSTEKADFATIGIPMAAGVESLNAAISGSLLMADWAHNVQAGTPPTYW